MKNKGGKRNVLYGNGKEYSEVSREIEETFHGWLAYAGMDEAEFDRRMSRQPHKVEEGINEDGDIEVNIYAGFMRVIPPLIFQPSGGGSLDDFLVNALLLFSHIAARYEDKRFEKAVGDFAERMIAERKMSLGKE